MSGKELIRSYLNFCNYRKKFNTDGKIDLSSEKWFYPTTLLPLGNFIHNNPSISYIPPLDNNVKKYLLLMITGQVSEGASYIPILQRKVITKEDSSMIYDLVSEKCNTNDKNTFMYFISELAANVAEHSLCDNSLFMAQQYIKKRFTEIAFFDNGITIAGSLRRNDKGEDKSDQELIVEAIHGLSSKSEGSRGRGLGSSINIIINLLKGEVFIASGKGAFYLSKDEEREYSYILNEEQELNGTLISFRIPFPVPKKSDIYKPGIL